MLKSDFHIHTGEDPYDKIKYSSQELINYAAKLGFDVLSITNHHRIHYSKGLADYAKRKGILLIPGVETHINGREVLLLNVRKPGRIEDFSELEKLRKENVVIIAPHPFYPISQCLGNDLIKNIQYFDGIEYSHFYLKELNVFNQKALDAAKQHNKTLIGTSDAHRFCQIGYTYSIVDANKNIDSVLEAIRKGKVEIKTKGLSLFSFLRIFVGVFYSGIRRKIKNIRFDDCYF